MIKIIDHDNDDLEMEVIDVVVADDMLIWNDAVVDDVDDSDDADVLMIVWRWCIDMVLMVLNKCILETTDYD